MKLPTPHTVLTPREFAALLRADARARRRRVRLTHNLDHETFYDGLASSIDDQPDNVELARKVLTLWNKDQSWLRARRTRTFAIALTPTTSDHR
ncbi:hypothetical protein [Gordonia sp. SMJS1]|uniref:hypothetical protein n=1 Tax=Gordonia sp. SMJS1 TaxID=3039400 RepID=UPI00245758E9|nr:hypothetical protein [Gordonia sp. SMJS1]WGJ88031.1 hypothetical protein QAD21_24275 [Gordonia sp. SMJS1]